MSDHLTLRSWKDTTIFAKEIQFESEIMGFRLKAMHDGTLWMSDYDQVWKLDIEGAHIKHADGFSIGNNTTEGTLKIIGLLDAPCASPILGTLKHGLIQVTHEGVKVCTIAAGKFHQITINQFDPRYIYALRKNNYVSIFTYNEEDGCRCEKGNRWIHVRDIFINTAPLDVQSHDANIKAYTRIQVTKTTILVATKWLIDELDIKTGAFKRRHINPAIETGGMYLCCVDKEETALVVDMKQNAYYLLEPNSPEADPKWTKLTIEGHETIQRPFNATLYKDKVYLVNKDGKLFMLSRQNVEDQGATA